MFIKEMNALGILFCKTRGHNPYRKSERLKLHAHMKAINYWGEEKILEIMKEEFDWNLKFIPMDRLSYFITFIQSHGPTYEEVAFTIKENMVLDKTFKMALDNG